MTEVDYLRKLINEVRLQTKLGTLTESKETATKDEGQELKEHLAKEVTRFLKDLDG